MMYYWQFNDCYFYFGFGVFYVGFFKYKYTFVKTQNVHRSILYKHLKLFIVLSF